jgi:hypothetical protein
MKKIITLVAFSLLLFSCSTNFFSSTPNKAKAIPLKISEDFVQGSEDIPLLLGMTKISGESVGFDSSSGSIMSSSYSTKNNTGDIREFYLKTLPGMDWRVVDKCETTLSFKRENEKLEIEFSKKDKKNIVKFFISSAL